MSWEQEVAVVAWIAALAHADSTTHEFEAAAGADLVTRTDWMFSPLPHDGIAPSVDLGWSPRGRRDANVVRLSFTPANIASGPSWSFTWDGETRETFPSSATMVDLQYAYGRRIDAGAWTVHVGATSANHFENVVDAFAINAVETYFGVFELAPRVEARWKLSDRHTIELEGWTPLLAWVARNPYPMHNGEHIWNTRDNQPVFIIFRYIGDGRLQTLDTYQAVHLRTGYALRLSNRFTALARVRVDGFHDKVPWPLAEWQAGLDLGLRGTF
ncbi:MAG: hypothetical protein H6738_09865 [Alphaproteobacteria bacterium]|nr:hypothetical protein [Alphaproteobacteria bacterium]